MLPMKRDVVRDPADGVAMRLRAVPEFRDMPRAELDPIAASARLEDVNYGDAILEQDVSYRGVVVLLRGAAMAVRQTTDGDDRVLLGIVYAPCIIPDASALDTGTAQLTWQAVEACQIAVVPFSQVVRASMAPSIAQRLRDLTDCVDDLTGGPVEERLVRCLDRLAARHGTPLEGGRMVALRLGRRALAQMINATTETASRLMAKFQREGRSSSDGRGLWWLGAAKPGLKSTPPPAEVRVEGKERAG